ncbi:MAG: hypothetical protein Q8M01_12560 [Rubrivivax sp.]|nr:hypothetical protein [Rubrivivax sp.]
MTASLGATASLCVVLLGSALGAHVQAAQECRYSAEHGAPGRTQTLTRTLSVGEIHRQPLPALARLTNHGPHDIRLTFDGAAPRQLSRDAREPAQGRFRDGVALSSVECLPGRSAGPAAGAEGGTLARHGRFAEHAR